MEHISISPEIQQFREHLRNNPRTVLSAKFGDGKTTFLREFSNEYAGDFLTITLRPVNYSVLKNEDIFEYVKRDILVRLADEKLIPKISGRDIRKLVGKNVFSLENLDAAIDDILRFVDYGKALLAIKKTVQALIQKNGGFGEVVKSVSPERMASEYVSSFATRSGSLYEEDAYTLLIRQCLSKQHKRSLLIIEDLDRIDPAHLFRILNVLAAHIDDNSDENKFGFDSIILVLDYNCTKHIFEHFYGKDSSYQGYMTKYMSHYPFEFSIADAACSRLYELIESRCGIPHNTMRKMVMTCPVSHSSPECFDTLIRTKTVRDIAHAIDDIDSQYKNEIITFGNGNKILSEEKIVILLSILKRLNIPISRNYILPSIINLGVIGFNLLGNYTLCEIKARSGFFYVHGKSYTLNVKQLDDGICTCSYNEYGSGYSISIDINQLCGSAFDEAAKRVKDLVL